MCKNFTEEKDSGLFFFCQTFNIAVSYLTAFQRWHFILGLASDNSSSNPPGLRSPAIDKSSLTDYF